ncbi:hypothetical protein P7L79_28870 [Tistrella mobilis]|uniref:hypothetical protein n=1 Tax=Tistrella mobilis TaxID=171437 RepID=UPI0035571D58
MNETSRPPQGELYEHVRRAAELDGIVLRKAEIDIHPVAHTLIRQHADRLRFAIDRAQPLATRDRATGTVVGTFDLKVTVKAPKDLIQTMEAGSGTADDSLLSVVLISGRYDVSYFGIPADADDAAVHQFIGLVAKFAVYPYFRNFVAAAAGMADLQLPILPVLREPQDKLSQSPRQAGKRTGTRTSRRQTSSRRAQQTHPAANREDGRPE